MIREISELAMMKRARIERMKNKMKNAKSSSSNGNLCAMVVTVISWRDGGTVFMFLPHPTIHAEEPVASRTSFEIAFYFSKLENKDVFSKSDPFLIISKFVTLSLYGNLKLSTMT